jgi:hypothetical protein
MGEFLTKLKALCGLNPAIWHEVLRPDFMAGGALISLRMGEMCRRHCANMPLVG